MILTLMCYVSFLCVSFLLFLSSMCIVVTLIYSMYRVSRVPEQGAHVPRGYDVYAALQNRRCLRQMACVIMCVVFPSIHLPSQRIYLYFLHLHTYVLFLFNRKNNNTHTHTDDIFSSGKVFVLKTAEGRGGKPCCLASSYIQRSRCDEARRVCRILRQAISFPSLVGS